MRAIDFFLMIFLVCVNIPISMGKIYFPISFVHKFVKQLNTNDNSIYFILLSSLLIVKNKNYLFDLIKSKYITF